MRIPGWCEKCRKPKRVKADMHSLVSGAIAGVVQGVCEDCEHAERRMHIGQRVSHATDRRAPTGEVVSLYDRTTVIVRWDSGVREHVPKSELKEVRR